MSNVARQWMPPVLGMLCLRALIPAGFMLAPVDGRLGVILCDTDAPGAAHHHHGQGQPGHHHHHTQLDPTCPYAQSAGPAPLPALPVLKPPRIATTRVFPRGFSQNNPHSGPLRQHFPRGPPHLA